jgi:hypothetical protein
MSTNPEEFQESVTKELEVVKDRVRNLIGNAHWGEEGRYKEAVLMNVIRRFLPSDLSAGTGFVVKSEARRAVHERITVSKQIDIIVYDNRIPVLFSEGDFIITTHTNVRGLVEVKTKVENAQLREILRKSISNTKIVGDNIFSGIFAFEYNRRNSREHLVRTLESLGEDGKYVNHISLGSQIFVKHWTRNGPVRSDGCDHDFYGIYDFSDDGRRPKKLSFSYFISNLLYSVSEHRLSDRLWLLFPAKGGKERYRVDTACLRRRGTVS